MKSIKILSLFTLIAVLSGMSQPVSAFMNRARTSISANGYLVDLGPVFSETEQEITSHSGFDRPGDKNLKAHTHFKFMIPAIGIDKLNTAIRSSPYMPIGLPPISGFGYETPASLACVYNLATPSPGCNPNIVTTPATGGSKVIAIVVAYHYRFAKDDLTAFSTQFGLPLPTATNFQVLYANGLRPSTDPWGWEVEAALDLQWAHAMAPNAKLILVEAASASWTHIMIAITRASALVAKAGGGEVSMSFGGTESPGETAYESRFKTPKVVYLAASGNEAGTSFPCVSPNVVCVGGTTLRRHPTSKALLQEIAWIDGGGGISPNYVRPAYQNAISKIVGSNRGVPDVSLAADPRTGGWIFYTSSDDIDDSYWLTVGGTSWATATFAGIVNSAKHFYTSSVTELKTIYAGIGNKKNFRNISAGYCGEYVGWSATANPQWDFCTGVGSSLGKLGK
jgi:subtilase family serine protease